MWLRPTVYWLLSGVGSVGYVPVSVTIVGVLSAEKKRQKRIVQVGEKVKTYNTGKNMGYK